jgi:hypothetical protein
MTSKEQNALNNTASKRGDELTPKEVNAEREVARRAERKPSNDGEHVEQIDLPNGHELKKRKDGMWCRFSSEPGDCGPQHNPDKPKEAQTLTPDALKADWSQQAQENSKAWPQELWAEVEELLARKDPIVARVIQEAAERSPDEAITRIRKLAHVFRSKPSVPQSITKGTVFSERGTKGGYTSTIYNMAEDPNLLIKPAGGRLQKEATAMIELEMLDIPTVYVGKADLESGEQVLLLEKIEDAVGSKSIIGRTKTPLNPPQNTEVVTQRTIDDLEDIYRKLERANANVGDFQFVVRRSDGAVFVNDPTSFGIRRQGPIGDIENIKNRFKKILREKNEGGN